MARWPTTSTSCPSPQGAITDHAGRASALHESPGLSEWSRSHARACHTGARAARPAGGPTTNGTEGSSSTAAVATTAAVARVPRLRCRPHVMTLAPAMPARTARGSASSTPKRTCRSARMVVVATTADSTRTSVSPRRMPHQSRAGTKSTANERNGTHETWAQYPEPLRFIDERDEALAGDEARALEQGGAARRPEQHDSRAGSRTAGCSEPEGPSHERGGRETHSARQEQDRLQQREVEAPRPGRRASWARSRPPATPTAPRPRKPLREGGPCCGGRPPAEGAGQPPQPATGCRSTTTAASLPARPSRSRPVPSTTRRVARSRPRRATVPRGPGRRGAVRLRGDRACRHECSCGGRATVRARRRPGPPRTGRLDARSVRRRTAVATRISAAATANDRVRRPRAGSERAEVELAWGVGGP